MNYRKANRLIVSFRDLYKMILGMIAYYIVFPSFLTAFLHRLRGVKIKNIWKIYISYHVLIDSVHPEAVEIGEDAWLTRDVKIIAHFNPTPVLKDILGGKKVEEVKIGRGAFIGIGAILLPGVHIGEGSLVGAGSVVTRDVPDYTMVAGNPARPIKSFKELKDLPE
jgi:acetyltransferase-like isoleucine patch superfamily enzyme